MGSKGQTVNTKQTYRPTESVRRAGEQSLDMATAAANQPFQMPAQPVAGFSPLQQQYFDQIGSLGADSQYLKDAYQSFQNAGQPVSQDDINSYLNPYADAALANMKKYIFDPQSRDTMSAARQRMGGPGADRLALTQQNLNYTQADSLNQAYAGFYQNAMQQAQRAKEMQMAQGQGYMNLQGNAINSANNLFGAGQQQQAQQQRELMSPYMQELARIAYPFQTAQFLSGITAGVAPSQGGTTTGQTTYPAPSLGSQLLGAGMMGLGAYNMMPTLGVKGAGVAGSGQIGSIASPNAVYGNYGLMADGGEVNPWNANMGYDDGGATFDDRFPMEGEVPQGGGEAEPLRAFGRTLPLPVEPGTMQEVPVGIGDPAKTAELMSKLPPRVPPQQPPAAPEEPRGPLQMTVGPRPPQPQISSPAVLPRPTPDPSVDVESFLIPEGKKPYPDATARDWGQNLARSPWMSLISAGAKMMQTPGSFGTALGAGAEAGVKELQSQRKEGRAEELINQKAQDLYREAMSALQAHKRTKFSQGLWQTSEGEPTAFDPSSGLFTSGITGQRLNPDVKLTPIPGRGGAQRDPAIVRTIEWMVRNGLSPDQESAFNRLRQSAGDKSRADTLIKEWAKIITQQDPMITPEAAKKRAEDMLRGATPAQ